VKERRLAAAQEKRDVLLAQWQDSHVGQVIRVMVDKETGHKGGRYEYEGRSCWDAPEIDGLVSFSGVGHFLPGQLASVRITHSKDYILSGEIANDFGK
jgi:ribosomal protein S12 methylthiotransferase